MRFAVLDQATHRTFGSPVPCGGSDGPEPIAGPGGLLKIATRCNGGDRRVDSAESALR